MDIRHLDLDSRRLQKFKPELVNICGPQLKSLHFGPAPIRGNRRQKVRPWSTVRDFKHTLVIDLDMARSYQC